MPDGDQQNWPMKNEKERDANKQAGDHATPKPPVTPRLYLIILGHRAILLPLCRRAKGKWEWQLAPAAGCQRAVAATFKRR
jgi:hypothetical protein